MGTGVRDRDAGVGLALAVAIALRPIGIVFAVLAQGETPHSFVLSPRRQSFTGLRTVRMNCPESLCF